MLFTGVIIFNLISPGAPGLAGIPQQVATNRPYEEAECQQLLAEQMNRLREGLEAKYGKGALLITGGCFSGISRGPDGSIFYPEVKPEGNEPPASDGEGPKSFR